MSTPQAPIGSGFGAATTAAEILRGCDLSGKTAIVTGGYSGIGRETARVLQAAGARVIVPARDRGRAAAALAGLDGIEIERWTCSIRRRSMISARDFSRPEAHCISL
jgi:NAD(P)-dependent dehydrogenase (short-subunit alcohol dehydrogenase family)